MHGSVQGQEIGDVQLDGPTFLRGKLGQSKSRGRQNVFMPILPKKKVKKEGEKEGQENDRTQKIFVM